jgi:hypothetical protein
MRNLTLVIQLGKGLLKKIHSIMMKKIAILSFLIFVTVLSYQLYLRHQNVPIEKNLVPLENSYSKPNKTKEKSKNSDVKRQHNTNSKKSTYHSIKAPKKELSQGSLQESKHQHLQLPSGEIIITQVIVQDGLLISHGDLIVGREEDLPSLQNNSKPLILAKPRLWEKGIVPYRIQPGLPNYDFVKKAIQYMEMKTPLKFVQRKDQRDFITFKEGSENCYSNLGRIGGEQFITLARGCKTYEIVHEIMHAIGFFHEQNRSDRDEYIKVLWENIDETNWLQFQIIENTFVDLTKFPFDFKSIMLYPSNSFSLFPDDYSMVDIGGEPFLRDPYNERVLSEGDIKKVK